MSADWRTVRVFISSTFRDMQAERDYLVRFVFPKLREALLPRRVHLVDIDLRWGVAADQDAFDLCMDEIDRCHPRFICLLGGRYGWVPPPKTVSSAFIHQLLDGSSAAGEISFEEREIITSIYALDESHEVYRCSDKPREAAQVEKWFKRSQEAVSILQRAGLAEAKRSITASEIFYGVLDRLSEPAFRYFYFRDPSVTGSISEPDGVDYREPAGSFGERALEELKLEITRSFGNVLTSSGVVRTPLPAWMYPCAWDQDTRRITKLESLGSRVFSDLLASVDAEFGTVAPAAAGEFDDESLAMEAFAEARVEHFVAGTRSRVLQQLASHVNDTHGNGYLCLVSESGSGKSALLAKLYRDYIDHAEEEAADKRPLIVAHFVGASASSTDVRQLLRRLCHELINRTGILETVPEEYEKVRHAFPKLLEEASIKRRVVVLIDGLDQLQETYHSQQVLWLPEFLPDGVRIILSAEPGNALDSLNARLHPPVQVTLPPLEESDTIAIVEYFLARYRKTLDADQLAMLLAKRDVDKPLFIVTALEELRTLGTFEAMSEHIRELPQDVETLFDWILRRLERDEGFRDKEDKPLGAELVRRFCSYIIASRFGMSHNELSQLIGRAVSAIGTDRDEMGNVAALERLLRPYLMLRENLLDLSHAQFRKAARDRYLNNPPGSPPGFSERLIHQDLAGYFEERWPEKDTHALSELSYHMIQAGDMSGLGRLATSQFLEVKAEVSGDVHAFSDARAIARALATDAETTWDDLIYCARKYCDLGKRVREAAESFDRMLDRGDISGVLNAVNAETNLGKRKGLLIALSTLFDDKGYIEISRRLSADAASIRSESISLPAIALLKENIETEGPLTDIAAEPSRESSAKARTSVPASHALLGYVCSSRLVVTGFFGFVFFSIVILFPLKLLNPNRPPGLLNAIRYLFSMQSFDWASVLRFPGVLFVGFFAVYFVWICAGPFIGYFASRKSKAAADVIDGLVAGIDAAPSSLRAKQLTRALRYQSFITSWADPGLYRAPVLRLSDGLRGEFRNAPSVEEKARWILRASGSGELIRAGMVEELKRLSSAELDAIFKELVSKLSTAQDDWEVFRIIAATVKPDCDAGVLRHLIALPPDLPNDTDSQRMREQQLTVLRSVPRIFLARSILALHSRVIREQRTDGGSLRTWYRSQVGRAADAYRYSISWVEPLLAAFVFGPAFIGLSVGAVGFVLIMLLPLAFIGVVFGICAVAGRKRDPYHLLRLPRDEDLPRYRADLSLAVEKSTSFSMQATRVRDVIAVQRLLRNDLASESDASESFDMRPRVLRSLIKQRLVGRVGASALAVMHQEHLLLQLSKLTRKSKAVRRAAIERDADELRCVLPLPSSAQSFLLTVTLACLGSYLSLFVLVKLFTLPESLFALKFATASSLFVCAFLAMTQHVYVTALFRSKQRAKPLEGLDYMLSGFAIIAFLLAAIHYAAKTFGIAEAPEVYFAVLSVPILVTNLAVPELIARWRGAGLFYPTKLRLWSQRVLWILLAAASCVAIAIIAFLLLALFNFLAQET